MQVLVVDSPLHALPHGTADLLGDIGWHIVRADGYAAAVERVEAGAIDAAVLAQPADAQQAACGELLRCLETRRITALLMTDRPPAAPAKAASLMDIVDPNISLAELRGRLTMIERYHPLLRRLEDEMQNMERISRQLSDHFQEIDQEFRLAARLQRDFLPDLREPFGGTRIAALFRPASWVSGDMYDVFRIDDQHTGIYIVDAVGHGMAASLLTMFIKRAVVPTRNEGGMKRILTPSEVMAALNDALTDQALPQSQFVTACYGLLHHPTLTFQFARGGHPYPLHIRGGVMNELKAVGGLLGIAKGESFATLETQLHPGDKLLFYTDGVELAFPGADGGLDARSFHRAFASVATLPIDEMLRRIDARLDGEPGSSHPRDDVTIVGLEVPRDAPVGCHWQLAASA